MNDIIGFINAVKVGQLGDVKGLFNKEYVNKIWKGRTALHYGCERTNDYGGAIVRYLLCEGWSIESTDVYKWRPIHYAVSAGNIDAVRLLMKSGCNLHCRTNNGDSPIDISMKYIGTGDNEKCMRILLSSTIGYNLMYILVSHLYPFSFKYMYNESLQYDQEKEDTVDRWGQTPLHVAIRNRTEENCDYLVDNTRNIETEDFMGFTVLERAVLNNCKNICDRLVKNGSRCDRYVNMESHVSDIDEDTRRCFSSQESIYSLCLKKNRTIYPCLLATIDGQTINIIDGHKNTLLHLCAVSLLPDMCSQLIFKSANMNLRNDKGNTPLLELLQGNITHNMKQFIAMSLTERSIKNNNDDVMTGDGDIFRDNDMTRKMIETVNVLIDGGVSVNDEDSRGSNVLYEATKYHNEKLLLALIRQKEEIEAIKKPSFIAWIYKKHFRFLKEVIPIINKSLMTQWITPEHITNSVVLKDLSLVKIMYDNASNNVQTIVLETILIKAASMDDQSLFEEMITNEISTNNSLAGEESLLTSLIRDRKTDFCRILLQSRNAAGLLERKDAENKLALHVCIETEYWDIIDLFIQDTISVDEEDNNGHTPMSLLLEKISQTDNDAIIDRMMTYIRMLLKQSSNIYQLNRNGQMVISFCTNSVLRVKIETFVGRQPSNEYTQPTDEDAKGESTVSLCQICADEPINCTLNCGHLFCTTCVERTFICFVCRGEITNVIKHFL